MINELFIKSPDKITYNENKQDISDDSLVFIEKDESLIAQGHEYQFIPSNGEKGQVLSKTEDGVKWKDKWRVFDEYVSPYLDAVLVNNSTLEKVATQDLKNYKPSEWTPIGIVVIPASHGVYGTGEAGVMSLTYMDYNNPDTGWTKTFEEINSDSSVYMYSGHRNSGWISGMPQHKYARCPQYGTMNQSPSTTLNRSLTSDTSNNHIPSDQFNGYKCMQDVFANWYPYDANNRYYCPSPYLSNGRKNPDYHKNTGNYSENDLARFNGKELTEFILNIATAQEDWRTASTIDNKFDSNYTPMACCAWRFHTVGTSQGDWYLPTPGELGYIVARFKAIDSTVQLINSVFGNKALGIIYNNNLMSSQQTVVTDTTNGFMRASTMNGAIGNTGGNALATCRAMIRLTI